MVDKAYTYFLTEKAQELFPGKTFTILTDDGALRNFGNALDKVPQNYSNAPESVKDIPKIGAPNINNIGGISSYFNHLFLYSEDRQKEFKKGDFSGRQKYLEFMYGESIGFANNSEGVPIKNLPEKRIYTKEQLNEIPLDKQNPAFFDSASASSIQTGKGSKLEINEAIGKDGSYLKKFLPNEDGSIDTKFMFNSSSLVLATGLFAKFGLAGTVYELGAVAQTAIELRVSGQKEKANALLVSYAFEAAGGTLAGIGADVRHNR